MGEQHTQRVLALPGSLRSGTLNRRLLDAAVEAAPAGMTIAIYDALGTLPFFDEDVEVEAGGGPESVRRLGGLLREADGLLIATPEYNQSFPGVLKNAIDWLSRAAPEPVLPGKPVALICSCGRRLKCWTRRKASPRAPPATRCARCSRPSLAGLTRFTNARGGHEEADDDAT